MTNTENTETIDPWLVAPAEGEPTTSRPSNASLASVLLVLAALGTFLGAHLWSKGLKEAAAEENLGNAAYNIVNAYEGYGLSEKPTDLAANLTGPFALAVVGALVIAGVALFWIVRSATRTQE